MTDYVDFALEEFFTLVQGRAAHTRDSIERNPGPYPVYSASLLMPFGHIATFDHEGPRLTWIMNGYGGHMQEVDGRFSATRDRGVLVPRNDVRTPDLAYVRLAAEPQLVAAAVGRIVEGRKNNYTKVYPGEAGKVTFPVPIGPDGEPDYSAMAAIGTKLRRVEAAREAVAAAADQLDKAVLAVEPEGPTRTVSLGDEALFTLSIGERVLRTSHVTSGVPAYSANALVPFGLVSSSNLSDFSRPSILWGIDGVFDLNFILRRDLSPSRLPLHCSPQLGSQQAKAGEADARRRHLIRSQFPLPATTTGFGTLRHDTGTAQQFRDIQALDRYCAVMRSGEYRPAETGSGSSGAEAVLSSSRRTLEYNGEFRRSRPRRTPSRGQLAEGGDLESNLL